jgi:hypothetical protein
MLLLLLLCDGGGAEGTIFFVVHTVDIRHSSVLAYSSTSSKYRIQVIRLFLPGLCLYCTIHRRKKIQYRAGYGYSIMV